MNGTQERPWPCWQDPATAACPMPVESNRRVVHYVRYALRNHTSLLRTQDGEFLVWQQRNLRACTSYSLTHERVLTPTLFGIATRPAVLCRDDFSRLWILLSLLCRWLIRCRKAHLCDVFSYSIRRGYSAWLVMGARRRSTCDCCVCTLWLQSGYMLVEVTERMSYKLVCYFLEGRICSFVCR